MTRAIELLIAIAIVAVLFLLVGVILPSRRHVEHMVETNHPISQVYDTINSFKRFGDWHPLGLHDPAIQYRLEGEKRGVGAKLVYESTRKSIGTGNWEIVNSEEESQVEYAITNRAYGTNKVSLISLEQKGKTVEITWEYDVEYGWDLFGRYAGLYVGRNVGDDMKLGLGNLLGMIAAMPNYDYSGIAIEMVPVQPENVLYISTSADRNITAVENAMILSLKDLRAAVESNRLEATGSPRLITTNFGSEKYEFDVAIPVRRPLPGEDEPDEDASEPVEDEAMEDPVDESMDGLAEGEEMAADDMGEAAEPEEVDMTILPPPPPIEGLKLPTNVLAGQSYAGRALVTSYQGHPAALPLIRDMLRSYAAAHGEAIHDRSFEEYLTGIDDTSAEDARFKVYWPIKTPVAPAPAR